MMQGTRDDGGASLLPVLVVLAFVAVVVTALMDVANVSFKASGEVRALGQANYTADGALEFAISALERNRSLAKGPTPSCSFAFEGANDTQATVSCSAASAGSGSSNLGRPANALLATSSSPDAIRVNNNALLVAGDVYSNGGISIEQGGNPRLFTEGYVTAERGCTADSSQIIKVEGALGKDCAASHTTAGDDPDWSPAAGATFATASVDLTPLPASHCPSSADRYKLAILTPGKYSGDLKALLATRGCADAQGILFAPGVHYLEDVSNTDGLDLVAGTPGTWAGNSAPPRDGSACAQGLPGAQLILGGSTQIKLMSKNTVLNLCAPTTGLPIPLYGVKNTGAGLRAQATGATVLATSKEPSVFVYGTVYVPSGHVSAYMHNKEKTYFARGMIVHSLTADVSSSLKQQEEPIFLPPCAPSGVDACATDRHLNLTARVNGTDWLKARVLFHDRNPVRPGRPEIETWSLLK